VLKKRRRRRVATMSVGSNPFMRYYQDQVQTGQGGITVFRGYQRGRGFWSKVRKFIPIVGKFLGRRALNVAKKVGKDVLVDQQDLKTSLKRRGAEAVGDIGETAVKRFRQSYT